MMFLVLFDRIFIFQVSSTTRLLAIFGVARVELRWEICRSTYRDGYIVAAHPVSRFSIR